MKQVSPEVYFTEESLTTVSMATVDELAGRLADTERKRVRLCTHANETEKLQEMFVVLSRQTYIRPHRHLHKAESLHVIDGSADAVIFDDKGIILNVLPLGAYSTGRTFYYRLDRPVYHTLVLRSETLVFHETTEGPFVRVDSEFAPWAPNEQDIGAVSAFLEQLEHSVTAHGTPAHGITV